MYVSDTGFHGRVEFVNETPPYDYYDAVHSVLKNDMWEWALGGTKVTTDLPYDKSETERVDGYGVIENLLPVKYVNGEQVGIDGSRFTYGPKPFWKWIPALKTTVYSDDPFEGYEEIIPTGTRLEVNGAVEPEEDLFLHEIYRYLGFVYPDHPDRAFLLTRLEANDFFKNAGSLIDYIPNLEFFDKVALNLSPDDFDKFSMAIKIRNIREHAMRRKFFGASLGMRALGAGVFEKISVFPVGSVVPLKETTDRVFTEDYEVDSLDPHLDNKFRLIDFTGISSSLSSLKKKSIDTVITVMPGSSYTAYEIGGRLSSDSAIATVDPLMNILTYYGVDTLVRSIGLEPFVNKIVDLEGKTSKIETGKNVYFAKVSNKLSVRPIDSYVYPPFAEIAQNVKNFSHLVNYIDNIGKNRVNPTGSINSYYDYISTAKETIIPTVMDPLHPGSFMVDVPTTLSIYDGRFIEATAEKIVDADNNTYEITGKTMVAEDKWGSAKFPIPIGHLISPGEFKETFSEDIYTVVGYTRGYTNFEFPTVEGTSIPPITIPISAYETPMDEYDPRKLYDDKMPRHAVVFNTTNGKVLVFGKLFVDVLNNKPTKAQFFWSSIPTLKTTKTKLEELAEDNFMKLCYSDNNEFFLELKELETYFQPGSPYEVYVELEKNENDLPTSEEVKNAIGQLKSDLARKTFKSSDFNAMKRVLYGYEDGGTHVSGITEASSGDALYLDPQNVNVMKRYVKHVELLAYTTHRDYKQYVIDKKRRIELKEEFANRIKNKELLTTSDPWVLSIDEGTSILAIAEPVAIRDYSILDVDKQVSIVWNNDKFYEGATVSSVFLGSIQVRQVTKSTTPIEEIEAPDGKLINIEKIPDSITNSGRLLWFPKLTTWPDTINKNVCPYHSKWQFCIGDFPAEFSSKETTQFIERTVYRVKCEVETRLTQGKTDRMYFTDEESLRRLQTISIGDIVWGPYVPQETFVSSVGEDYVELTNFVTRNGKFFVTFECSKMTIPIETDFLSFKRKPFEYGTFDAGIPFDHFFWGGSTWPNARGVYLQALSDVFLYEPYHGKPELGIFDPFPLVVRECNRKKYDETRYKLAPAAVDFSNQTFVELNISRLIDGVANRVGETHNLLNVEWLDYLMSNLPVISMAKNDAHVGASVFMQTSITGNFSDIIGEEYTDPDTEIRFLTVSWPRKNPEECVPAYAQIGSNGDTDELNKLFAQSKMRKLPNVYGVTPYDAPKNGLDLLVNEFKREDPDFLLSRRGVYSMISDASEDEEINDALDGVGELIFEQSLSEYEVTSNFSYYARFMERNTRCTMVNVTFIKGFVDSFKKYERDEGKAFSISKTFFNENLIDSKIVLEKYPDGSSHYALKPMVYGGKYEPVVKEFGSVIGVNIPDENALLIDWPSTIGVTDYYSVYDQLRIQRIAQYNYKASFETNTPSYDVEDFEFPTASVVMKMTAMKKRPVLDKNGDEMKDNLGNTVLEDYVSSSWKPKKFVCGGFYGSNGKYNYEWASTHSPEVYIEDGLIKDPYTNPSGVLMLMPEHKNPDEKYSFYSMLGAKQLKNTVFEHSYFVGANGTYFNKQVMPSTLKGRLCQRALYTLGLISKNTPEYPIMNAEPSLEERTLESWTAKYGDSGRNASKILSRIHKIGLSSYYFDPSSGGSELPYLTADDAEVKLIAYATQLIKNMVIDTSTIIWFAYSGSSDCDKGGPLYGVLKAGDMIGLVFNDESFEYDVIKFNTEVKFANTLPVAIMSAATFEYDVMFGKYGNNFIIDEIPITVTPASRINNNSVIIEFPKKGALNGTLDLSLTINPNIKARAWRLDEDGNRAVPTESLWWITEPITYDEQRDYLKSSYTRTVYLIDYGSWDTLTFHDRPGLKPRVIHFELTESIGQPEIIVHENGSVSLRAFGRMRLIYETTYDESTYTFDCVVLGADVVPWTWKYGEKLNVGLAMYSVIIPKTYVTEGYDFKVVGIADLGNEYELKCYDIITSNVEIGAWIVPVSTVYSPVSVTVIGTTNFQLSHIGLTQAGTIASFTVGSYMILKKIDSPTPVFVDVTTEELPEGTLYLHTFKFIMPPNAVHIDIFLTDYVDTFIETETSGETTVSHSITNSRPKQIRDEFELLVESNRFFKNVRYFVAKYEDVFFNDKPRGQLTGVNGYAFPGNMLTTDDRVLDVYPAIFRSPWDLSLEPSFFSAYKNVRGWLAGLRLDFNWSNAVWTNEQERDAIRALLTDPNESSGLALEVKAEGAYDYDTSKDAIEANEKTAQPYAKFAVRLLKTVKDKLNVGDAHIDLPGVVFYTGTKWGYEITSGQKPLTVAAMDGKTEFNYVTIPRRSTGAARFTSQSELSNELKKAWPLNDEGGSYWPQNPDLSPKAIQEMYADDAFFAKYGSPIVRKIEAVYKPFVGDTGFIYFKNLLVLEMWVDPRSPTVFTAKNAKAVAGTEIVNSGDSIIAVVALTPAGGAFNKPTFLINDGTGDNDKISDTASGWLSGVSGAPFEVKKFYWDGEIVYLAGNGGQFLLVPNVLDLSSLSGFREAYWKVAESVGNGEIDEHDRVVSFGYSKFDERHIVTYVNASGEDPRTFVVNFKKEIADSGLGKEIESYQTRAGNGWDFRADQIVRIMDEDTGWNTPGFGEDNRTFAYVRARDVSYTALKLKSSTEINDEADFVQGNNYDYNRYYPVDSDRDDINDVDSNGETIYTQGTFYQEGPYMPIENVNPYSKVSDEDFRKLARQRHVASGPYGIEAMIQGTSLFVYSPIDVVKEVWVEDRDSEGIPKRQEVNGEMVPVMKKEIQVIGQTKGNHWTRADVPFGRALTRAKLEQMGVNEAYSYVKDAQRTLKTYIEDHFVSIAGGQQDADFYDWYVKWLGDPERGDLMEYEDNTAWDAERKIATFSIKSIKRHSDGSLVIYSRLRTQAAPNDRYVDEEFTFRGSDRGNEAAYFDYLTQYLEIVCMKDDYIAMAADGVKELKFVGTALVVQTKYDDYLTLPMQHTSSREGMENPYNWAASTTPPILTFNRLMSSNETRSVYFGDDPITVIPPPNGSNEVPAKQPVKKRYVKGWPLYHDIKAFKANGRYDDGSNVFLYGYVEADADVSMDVTELEQAIKTYPEMQASRTLLYDVLPHDGTTLTKNKRYPMVLASNDGGANFDILKFPGTDLVQAVNATKQFSKDAFVTTAVLDGNTLMFTVKRDGKLLDEGIIVNKQGNSYDTSKGASWGKLPDIVKELAQQAEDGMETMEIDGNIVMLDKLGNYVWIQPTSGFGVKDAKVVRAGGGTVVIDNAPESKQGREVKLLVSIKTNTSVTDHTQYLAWDDSYVNVRGRLKVPYIDRTTSANANRVYSRREAYRLSDRDVMNDGINSAVEDTEHLIYDWYENVDGSGRIEWRTNKMFNQFGDPVYLCNSDGDYLMERDSDRINNQVNIEMQLEQGSPASDYPQAHALKGDPGDIEIVNNEVSAVLTKTVEKQRADIIKYIKYSATGSLPMMVVGGSATDLTDYLLTLDELLVFYRNTPEDVKLLNDLIIEQDGPWGAMTNQYATLGHRVVPVKLGGYTFLYDKETRTFRYKNDIDVRFTISVPYETSDPTRAFANSSFILDGNVALDHEGYPVSGVMMPYKGYGGWTENTSWDSTLPWLADPDGWTEKPLVNSMGDDVYMTDETGARVISKYGSFLVNEPVTDTVSWASIKSKNIYLEVTDSGGTVSTARRIYSLEKPTLTVYAARDYINPGNPDDYVEMYPVVDGVDVSKFSYSGGLPDWYNARFPMFDKLNDDGTTIRNDCFWEFGVWNDTTWIPAVYDSSEGVFTIESIGFKWNPKTHQLKYFSADAPAFSIMKFTFRLRESQDEASFILQMDETNKTSGYPNSSILETSRYGVYIDRSVTSNMGNVKIIIATDSILLHEFTFQTDTGDLAANYSNETAFGQFIVASWDSLGIITVKINNYTVTKSVEIGNVGAVENELQLAHWVQMYGQEITYSVYQKGLIVSGMNGPVLMKAPKWNTFREMRGELGGIILTSKDPVYEYDGNERLKFYKTEGSRVVFEELASKSMNEIPTYWRLRVLPLLSVGVNVAEMNNPKNWIEMSDKITRDKYGYDRIYFNPNGIPEPMVRIGTTIRNEENSKYFFTDDFLSSSGTKIYECDETGRYISYKKEKTGSIVRYILGNDRGDLSAEVTSLVDKRFNPKRPKYETCIQWFLEDFYVANNPQSPFTQTIQVIDAYNASQAAWKQNVEIKQWAKSGQFMILENVEPSKTYFNIMQSAKYSIDSGARIQERDLQIFDNFNSSFKAVLTLNDLDWDFRNKYGILVTNYKNTRYQMLVSVKYEVGSKRNVADPFDEESSIVQVKEFALLDKNKRMIAYARFPPIEYRTETQHLSFLAVINYEPLIRPDSGPLMPERDENEWYTQPLL